MHKPYTKQAQKVIELTTKAARSMHHNYIGTEHLLLGLLKEGSGVAACVLMDAGVEEPRLVELIEDLIAPSSDVAVLDRKGYSPRIQHINRTPFNCIIERGRLCRCTSVEYTGCEYPEDLYRDSGSHGRRRKPL